MRTSPLFLSYQLERGPWAASGCHFGWRPAGNNKEEDWEPAEQVWERSDIWMHVPNLLAHVPLSAHVMCSVLSEQKEIHRVGKKGAEEESLCKDTLEWLKLS